MKEKNTKSFDWLATGFYPASLVLMEALWISPWLSWLGVWPVYASPRPALGLPAVIIVIGLGLAVTRYFARTAWSTFRVQAAVIISGLLVMIVVLAIEYRGDYAF